VLSKQHAVPPPPTEFKRMVTRVVARVSGWAERTGVALVVRNSVRHRRSRLVPVLTCHLRARALTWRMYVACDSRC
jgi:hypothetical protein